VNAKLVKQEVKMDELGKIGWKYGLIKVSVEDEGTEFEEQINRLVELYPDENENYTMYCEARLMSVEEIEFALSDIKESGINEHFFNTGKFTESACETCYTSNLDWQSSDDPIMTTVIEENADGEPYLKLTADILSQMGWTEGDDIELDTNADGAFTLTKIEQKKVTTQWQEGDNDDNEELYAVYGGD
jgi:hypothetical protein